MLSFDFQVTCELPFFEYPFIIKSIFPDTLKKIINFSILPTWPVLAILVIIGLNADLIY